jgi:hypothetical protein
MRANRHWGDVDLTLRLFEVLAGAILLLGALLWCLVVLLL